MIACSVSALLQERNNSSEGLMICTPCRPPRLLQFFLMMDLLLVKRDLGLMHRC